MRSAIRSAAVISGCLLAVIDARANPLHLGRFGGLRGDPMYRGAFALYWNPASLAGPGWDLAVHGQLAARQATYFRDADSNGVTAEAQAANAGLGRVSTVGVIPGLAGRWGRRVGPVELGVGAGVYVDLGGAAAWDKNLSAPPQYPGAVDGPQRWSTISTSLTVITIAAGLAVRHPRTGLSLGIVPTLAIAKMSTLRARNLDRSDDLVDPAGVLKEGRAYFEGDGVTAGVQVGARWDINPRYGLGFTYQHAPQLRFDGTMRAAFGTQPETRERAILRVPIADTFQLAAALSPLSWLTLRPSLEWARWSVLQRHVFAAYDDGAQLLVVERDFSDSVAARLRADFRPLRRWVFTAGLGFEKGPTPTRTHEPGFGEGNSIEAGLAARVQIGCHTDLSASFVLQQFLDRRVRDSVHEPRTNGDYTERRELLLVDLEVHGCGPQLR